MNRSPQLLLWLGLTTLFLILGWALVRTPRRHSKEQGAKPYDVAVYEVYSDLLLAEAEQRSWFLELIDPLPEGILIRTDTTIDTGPGHGPGFEPSPASLMTNTMAPKQLDRDFASAVADYAQRNKESLRLQRKFTLPNYDLITTAEEEAVLKDEGHDEQGSGCWEFSRKHPNYYRWIEFSAVGFNEDQTAAFLYVVEWRGSRPLCQGGISGHGGVRALRKHNGEWQLADLGVFTDWVTMLKKPRLVSAQAIGGSLTTDFRPHWTWLRSSSAQ